MIDIVIVGGGNLAESLAIAVAQSAKLCLKQMYVRRQERAEELRALTGAECTTVPSELATADIYILAVSDGAIAELSSTLPFAKGAIVAHTAGSAPLSAISDSVRRAVIYPMQTFTKGRRVNFGIIPIFLEAEDEATLRQIEECATALSHSVHQLGSEQRRKLHLSAVFVSNFVNAMYIAGEELVAESGLSFEILKPLIDEVTAKACSSTSPRQIQTGPAARGDRATIERHSQMLDQNRELQEIYKNISNYIWETLKRI